MGRRALRLVDAQGPLVTGAPAADGTSTLLMSRSRRLLLPPQGAVSAESQSVALETVRTFPSVSAAAREYRLKSAWVSTSAIRKSSVRGLSFRYINEGK